MRLAGIEPIEVIKLAESRAGKPGDTVLDLMREGQIRLVFNTPSGAVARQDEVTIRSECILRDIPIITTRWGAESRHPRHHPSPVPRLVGQGAAGLLHLIGFNARANRLRLTG